MEKEDSLSECQIGYLSMIQGVINRMAESSVTIKGFAATVFAGVLAIVISSGIAHQRLVLAIAAIVIFAAFLFDWYYFYQEKQYRALYDNVRSGLHECNFELNNPRYPQVTSRDALKSFSLWAYYGLLEFLLIAIIVSISVGVL